MLCVQNNHLSIAIECSCLLPADFLHPASFCSFPFLVFIIRVSPSHIPFRVFWRDFPGHSAPSLISASPPNYLLLHLVTRWPSSFQKFQFNPSTILLFTGTVTSFRLLSLHPKCQLWHIHIRRQTFQHLKTSPRLCIDWLADYLHPCWIWSRWLRSNCISLLPSYSWTPGRLRPGVMWHPLTPQSVLPWALGTGDYGLSWVTTIRKSLTEFMIAETKRRQRPSLNPQIFWEFYQITPRRNHCWTPRFTFQFLQVVTNLEVCLPSQRLKSTPFLGVKTYLTIACHMSPS